MRPIVIDIRLMFQQRCMPVFLTGLEVGKIVGVSCLFSLLPLPLPFSPFPMYPFPVPDSPPQIQLGGPGERCELPSGGQLTNSF